MSTDPKTVEDIVKALRCCGNTDTKKPDCEHCPLLSTRMCVKVMLEGAADRIESLQAQLAAAEDFKAEAIGGREIIKMLQDQLFESQRRERAAVHDIMCRDHCDVCKYSKYDGRCDESDFDCKTCKNACPCATCRNESNWEWRGLQESGKGEAE